MKLIPFTKSKRERKNALRCNTQPLSKMHTY